MIHSCNSTERRTRDLEFPQSIKKHKKNRARKDKTAIIFIKTVYCLQN